MLPRVIQIHVDDYTVDLERIHHWGRFEMNNLVGGEIFGRGGGITD